VPGTQLLDTWTIFADENGGPRQEDFPDLLHPGVQGYAKMGRLSAPGSKGRIHQARRVQQGMTTIEERTGPRSEREFPRSFFTAWNPCACCRLDGSWSAFLSILVPKGWQVGAHEILFVFLNGHAAVTFVFCAQRISPGPLAR